MSSSPQVVVGKYGRVAILDVDGSIVEHVHPHAHGFIKVHGPDSRLVVADKQAVLSDNAIALLNSWVPHSGVSTEDGGSVRVLAFFVDLQRFARDEAGHCGAPQELMLQGTSHVMPARLRAATDDLKGRFADGRVAPDEVDDFFRILIAEYAAPVGRSCEGASARRIDYRIRRVMDQMKANPVLSQDLSACTRMAGLSRQHFFSLFRQSTGLSPRLFGNSLRLETAMNALSLSSTSIQALATDLGFSAPGHFTRFFLHHVGSTPSAFRRGMLGAP